MRRKEYLKILEDEINERIKLNAVFFDIKDFGAVDSKGYCSFREKLKSNDEYYLERNQDYQAICNILKSIKGIDFSKTYIFNKYIKTLSRQIFKSM